jgi:hypothetical protein
VEQLTLARSIFDAEINESIHLLAVANPANLRTRKGMFLLANNLLG